MHMHTLGHLRSLFEMVLVVIVIALSVAALGMSQVATAAEKRRWEPRATAGVLVLYLLAASMLFWRGSQPWQSLVGPFLVIPAVAVCASLGLNKTKYCDKCNATQPSGRWFAPPRFCSYCGAELDGKPPRDDRLLD